MEVGHVAHTLILRLTFPLAQIFYPQAFDLENNEGKLGLINSAPYLCCAFACW